MPMIQAYKTFLTFWQWATQYFDSSSSEFLDKSAIQKMSEFSPKPINQSSSTLAVLEAL